MGFEPEAAPTVGGDTPLPYPEDESGMSPMREARQPPTRLTGRIPQGAPLFILFIT